ncbi:MAG: transcription antitermination factor NusB [Clostridiales bacterium]|nr:transcription antitermination factor NusB [Clostridiales bacterium]
MTRNEARENMMKILYEMDMSKELNPESATSLVDSRLSGKHKERGRVLIFNILDNLDNIDDAINSHSKSWKTTRMPKVDLAIMRLALGEMNFSEDIPHAVAINEAINLSKKYSTEQSSRFVHGVLGAISNENEQ